MRKLIVILCLLLVLIGMTACGKSNNRAEESEISLASVDNVEVERYMIITVGAYSFDVLLEDNVTVNELLGILEAGPIVIEMEDYSGFEKVGSLGRSLTRNDKQITTNRGDIVLYNGNNIVVFYGSNSWSYTRIGRVENLDNWEEALGSGDVIVELSIGE